MHSPNRTIGVPVVLLAGICWSTAGLIYRWVEAAFLEVVEPTVAQAVERCIGAGATRVLLLPYFLFSGTHGVDDVERLRADFERRHPAVTFAVGRPLGVHPSLVDVVLARLLEVAPPQSKPAGKDGTPSGRSRRDTT